MTIYQELQLNQAGSKSMVRSSTTKKEKIRHISIYALKIFLTQLFCIVFVYLYSGLFGEENSIVGVAVLLAVLAFRQADLGFDAGQSALTILGIFVILAVGPKAANMVSPGAAFFINALCIFAIVVLGCHNVILFNHATFVLSYLLLFGYDVSGPVYVMRVIGLAAGGVVCAAIMYRNHRHMTYHRRFLDLFREFNLSSKRSRWQIQMALGISSAMFFATLIGLPRVMWVGIAVMSVLMPFAEDLKMRAKRRIPGNIAGGALFFLLTLLLPSEYYGIIGMLGGICVGLSATYFWQSIFNCFGALATGMLIYGINGAIALRIADNVFGIIYSVFFFYLFHTVITIITDKLNGKKVNCASEA